MASIIDKNAPKRGEIWLIDFSYKPKKEEIKEFEVKSRIKKIRPALIISNDTQNECDDELTIAPISSKEIEIDRPFEIVIKRTALNGLDKDSKILLNIIRSLSKNCLEEKLGQLTALEIVRLDEGLILSLDIKKNNFVDI